MDILRRDLNKDRLATYLFYRISTTQQFNSEFKKENMHGDETPARMKEKDNLKISLGQHRGFIAYFTFNF